MSISSFSVSFYVRNNIFDAAEPCKYFLLGALCRSDLHSRIFTSSFLKIYNRFPLFHLRWLENISSNKRQEANLVAFKEKQNITRKF